MAGGEFKHGLDICQDIKRWTQDLDVIFDVGANVGQSAVQFSDVFTGANIFCFEPVHETCEILRRNVQDNPKVSCFCKALGPGTGTGSMMLQSGSVNNSIVDRPTIGPTRFNDTTLRTVEMETLDNFCQERGLQWIDFLKIDTEGYDMMVLQGAQDMLDAHRIGWIQVEASMTHFNEKHVPFSEFTGFLEPKGYVLFGIYDQTPEWSGEARLRFSNPVFISEVHMERLQRVPISSSENGLRRRLPQVHP